MEPVRSRMRRVLHAIAFSLGAAGVACGARTEPIDERSAGWVPTGELDSGKPVETWGACIACEDAPAYCRHCYLQGKKSTWLCPVSWGAPSDACDRLDEVHHEGAWTFTCAYCEGSR